MRQIYKKVREITLLLPFSFSPVTEMTSLALEPQNAHILTAQHET
jgi:hypothetical protein